MIDCSSPDNPVVDPQSVSDRVKALTRSILLRSAAGLGCDDLVMELWRYVACLESNVEFERHKKAIDDPKAKLP